jgi:hypothetical protein
VFENRVLRRIFGPKRDEVTGEWRKLDCGELYNFYSSPDVIRQSKSKRMRWVGHVARMGEGRNVQGFDGSLKGKDQLKDKGVDGRMGSKWTLGVLVGGRRGVDSPGSGYGLLAGCCECGDEPSSSGATELVS